MTPGDRGFRARVRALPFWARLLVALLVFGAAGAVVHEVIHLLVPHSDRSLLEDELQFLGPGLAVGLISRWGGGYEAQRAASQAIRRRRIPDDADVDLVRRGLEGFRRANRQLRWWMVGMVGPMAVALAVVAGVRGPAWVWALVAGLLALLAGYWLMLRNRLGRVDVLLAELDRREAAQP